MVATCCQKVTLSASGTAQGPPACRDCPPASDHCKSSMTFSLRAVSVSTVCLISPWYCAALHPSEDCPFSQIPSESGRRTVFPPQYVTAYFPLPVPIYASSCASKCPSPQTFYSRLSRPTHSNR